MMIINVFGNGPMFENFKMAVNSMTKNMNDPKYLVQSESA